MGTGSTVKMPPGLKAGDIWSPDQAGLGIPQTKETVLGHELIRSLHGKDGELDPSARAAARPRRWTAAGPERSWAPRVRRRAGRPVRDPQPVRAGPVRRLAALLKLPTTQRRWPLDRQREPLGSTG